ncbi:TPA: hypothetical protein NKQ77_004583 [Vibrio parahaemolyticus]|nr:hypothetical protein [Vibrio parahaemolyticus]
MQVMISAFTFWLSDFPWSPDDAHRLFQNILNPKQVQKYLKEVFEVLN